MRIAMSLKSRLVIETGMSRLLYDPDFNDNEAKTLAQLGVTDGKMINVSPEDENRKLAVEFIVKHWYVIRSPVVWVFLSNAIFMTLLRLKKKYA